MNFKLTKFLVVSVIALLMFSSFVHANEGDNGIEKVVEGTKVELLFMEDEVKTGNKEIMIKLTDEKGTPIVTNNVIAVVEMDKKSDDMNSHDMSKAEPQTIVLESSHEKGEYMGNANFTDEGKWKIKAGFNILGQEKEVVFDIDVKSGGPNWFVIGGFVGFIALVIILSALTKKKKVIA